MSFPFHSGDRIGAEEEGEWGLRWPLCISLVSLCKLGLRIIAWVEVMLPCQNKFLQFLLRLVGSWSGPSDELEWSNLAGSKGLLVSDLVGFACPSLISINANAVYGSRRYAWQLVTEKSGWILLPTCLGGFVPCWVVSLAGESKFLVDLEASVLCSSSEVMADGHLMPGRSVCVRHTDTFNILLVEAIKNYCGSSSERGTEAPLSGDDTDGMLLQGPSCIFSISQGCLYNH